MVLCNPAEHHEHHPYRCVQPAATAITVVFSSALVWGVGVVWGDEK